MRYLLAVWILSFLFIKPSEADSIKIGVSTSLTGPASTWGQDILNGITYANNKLGENRYELLVEDDKCDPKESVNIANKFVNLNHLKYVMGTACSGALLAAAPVYEKAQVVTIGSTTSADSISAAGDYIFRTWPSDLQGAKKLAEYVQTKQKKIGILTEQTEYALGVQEGLKKYKGNLELVIEEFPAGMTDFRTQLMRLKSKNVDSIMLNPQGDLTLIPMLKQINQLQLRVPLYAIYYGASETVRNIGGELTNNLEFADIPEAESLVSSKGRTLLEEITSEYTINYSPTVVLLAYEGFMALDAAIKSKRDLREFLYSNSFDGSLGKWSFDQNGDLKGLDFVIKRIVDKKIVQLK